MQRIVVDAMGGDHAPEEIVKGAAEASLALPDAELILVGDAEIIGATLPRLRHDGARVRVHHAAQVVEMDEKPGEALAAKPDASILIAAGLVAAGEGDALVSAGNTGASGAGVRPAPGSSSPASAAPRWPRSTRPSCAAARRTIRSR
jgi:glycerol-3-phosphate acyltransferase PlsX